MTRAYKYTKQYADGEIDFDEYSRLMLPVLRGEVPNRIEPVQLSLF